MLISPVAPGLQRRDFSAVIPHPRVGRGGMHEHPERRQKQGHLGQNMPVEPESADHQGKQQGQDKSAKQRITLQLPDAGLVLRNLSSGVRHFRPKLGSDRADGAGWKHGFGDS
ncbi:hypothetical protein [Arenimonas terrae]|uniref:Uncharacterized protein n=1 Tax=Arenimonas terrae TaxID=2546226 RepID=A0A5C4RPU4_9GAMM|nr:hypothetical protein [Arenimonas terrae]TNJ32974.1 hypothetical protein E1B00_11700 [Arenimonas terrae]